MRLILLIKIVECKMPMRNWGEHNDISLLRENLILNVFLINIMVLVVVHTERVDKRMLRYLKRCLVINKLKHLRENVAF